MMDEFNKVQRDCCGCISVTKKLMPVNSSY